MHGSKQFVPLAGLLLAAAGCNDSRTSMSDPITAPMGPVHNVDYAIIDDGSYTGYSRDVAFVMYGGYAEMDGQEVTVEQNFKEEHQWQGYEYDGTITFPSADNTFGSGSPDAIDVARIYTTPEGSTTAYDRSGTVVPMSDGEVDEMNGSPEALGSRAPVDAPLFSSKAAQSSGTQALPSPRDKREPVDRTLVTAAGSLRTLARLRAANREAPGPGNLLLFTRREGAGEVRETWDPAVGAITEILVTADNGQTIRTLNRYVREGNVLALAEEQTTLLDPQGKLLGKFALHYRNHTLR